MKFEKMRAGWYRGMAPWVVALAVAGAAGALSSCATVGREFPESHVGDIQIGKTTQSDIQTLFGSPWRVGVEDGRRTWTYGRYRYKLFGRSNTKDLVVRFDERGVVASYSFHTTEHDE
jgi:hypothetical protein